MIQFIKEIAKRWQEPTPVFFKTIQKISASLALISVLVIGLSANGVHVPVFITQWLNAYSLNSGLVGTFLMQLASTWRDDDGKLDLSKKEKYKKEKENAN